MVKTWHCRDSVTQAAYDAQAASLRDRNRHRDTHMDYSEVGYPSISITYPQRSRSIADRSDELSE
jgi:hypothetical protein